MDWTGVVTPCIGTMAIGLGAYWPQFPGMREGLVEHHRRLLAKLPAGGYTPVEAGMVDSAAGAKRAGQLFRQQGVDLVLCQITTYANSETLLPAVRELDVPVVLLNVQAVRALDMAKVKTIKDWLGMGITCAALPEMTAGLRRIGKRFDIITGHLDGDPTVEAELKSWIAAAGLKRRLEQRCLALLGRPFQGMMDLNLDETNIFKKFGSYTHRLQWDDVVVEMGAVSNEDLAQHIATLQEIFAIAPQMAKDDLIEIARVFGALTQLIKRYELCGIASHYDGTPHGDHARVLAAFNPALSLLNTAGIACPVEGDIKTALAMLMLKAVGGSATLAELYSMDFDQDVCIIGHSGAGDAAISSRKPEMDISEVFHGKSGKGYVTQFYPSPGPVTLLSLTQDPGGEYRMIVAEGECIEGPALALGDTNCRVRFTPGLRRFVNDWSMHGPTHHGVLGLGRHIDALRKIAIALDLPIEIVCR